MSSPQTPSRQGHWASPPSQGSGWPVLSPLLCLCLRSSATFLLLDELPRARGQVHSEATPWEWKRRGREHGGKLPLSMEHRLQRREWKRGSKLKHPTHHSQEPAETSLPKAPDIWNGSSCWALLDPYLSEATPGIPERSPPHRRGRHCSIVQFVLTATAGLPGPQRLSSPRALRRVHPSSFQLSLLQLSLSTGLLSSSHIL